MKKPKGEKIKDVVVKHKDKTVTWEIYKEIEGGKETVTLYRKNVHSKAKKTKKSNS